MDTSARSSYSHVFKFDLFHEMFRQLISTARKGEVCNIREYIEDNHDLWISYDIELSGRIEDVLESELIECYELTVDPSGNVRLDRAKREPEHESLKDDSIRELVKKCLEACSSTQSTNEILDYVNSNRSRPTTSRSLQSSMCQMHDTIVHYYDGTWGLKSKQYTGYNKTYTARLNESRRNRMSGMLCEEPNVWYGPKTNLQIPDFELRYSTKRGHKPTEFFTNALSNSSRLDLGLGYFSSACFNVLACGFAHFVKNAGRMRMYINPHITEEDYQLLKNADGEQFEKHLLESYDSLLKVFSHRDELFFRCLAYLISRDRIEIKIAVLNDGGIAHEKFGVFTDSEGNEVGFNGSMNLTAYGLTRNIESIDCVCSWKNDDDKERIQCYHEDFESMWNGDNPDVMVYEADEFCKRVMETYPDGDIDELVKLEYDVLKELEQEENPPMSEDTPHFPSKFPSGAFPYQIKAYQNWCNHGKQGIFAMATGTGKTITSLNCALEEYDQDGFYHLVILVPSLALVEQWEKEARNFNFRNIITVSSENKDWKRRVVELAIKMSFGRQMNFVIISTYQSFVMTDFQFLLPKLSDNAILIADEAHNIGSSSVREAFRKLKIERRIALSATPKRVYDEEGTAEIESYFNDRPPYTYSFTMKRAIEEERLMSYKYFPRLVYLEEDEMQLYASYTRQLVQMYNETKQAFSDPDRAKRLLMLRKNVLHKARQKMTMFSQIIREIGEDRLKYCFVYSAAGKHARTDENDDEQLDEYILKEMQRVLKSVFPSVSCNSYTGVDSKEMRKRKLSAFAEGQLDVLFAKNCLDEGVDVPRAEYGIFTSSTGNPRQFIQRRGRLLRRHPDKRFAYIYDMVVAPDFNSTYYDRKFWTMEKHLVEGEMRRVANFAALSINYYNGAMDALEELTTFYEVDIDGMVLEENEQY